MYINKNKLNPYNGIEFLQGGNSIANTSLKSNILDNDWWTAYNKQSLEDWKRIFDNQNSTIKDINGFIQTYNPLRISSKYQDNGKAMYGKGVNQYQRNFHNKYKFGNNNIFWQFDSAKNPLNTHDIQAKEGEFQGDDYFGTQTAHRQISFFNDAELEEANKLAATRGWKFILDPSGYTDNNRKTYILAAIPNGTEAALQGNTLKDNTLQGNTPTEAALQKSKTSVGKPPLTFQKPKGPEDYKSSPWTDPIHLHGLHALNELGYRKEREAKYEIPISHIVPNVRYSKTTSGFAENQALLKRAAAIRANAQRNLTSNSETNQKILNYVDAQADALLDKVEQNKEKNKDYSQNIVDTDRNYNALQQTNATNVNNQYEVNGVTSRRVADQEYYKQSTANDVKLADDIAHSYAEWNQANKNNAERYYDNYNTLKGQDVLNDAYESLYDLKMNKYDSALVQPIYNQILSEIGDASESNPLYSRLSEEDKKMLMEWSGNIEDLKRYIKQNPQTALGQRFSTLVSDLQRKVDDNYKTIYDQVKRELDRVKSIRPILTTGEGLPNYTQDEKDLFNVKNIPAYRPTTMATGGRFSTWVEHYRKTIKDFKTNQYYTQRNTMQLLRAELDALNRKQIAILSRLLK